MGDQERESRLGAARGAEGRLPALRPPAAKRPPRWLRNHETLATPADSGTTKRSPPRWLKCREAASKPEKRKMTRVTLRRRRRPSPTIPQLRQRWGFCLDGLHTVGVPAALWFGWAGRGRSALPHPPVHLASPPTRAGRRVRHTLWGSQEAAWCASLAAMVARTFFVAKCSATKDRKGMVPAAMMARNHLIDHLTRRPRS